MSPTKSSTAPDSDNEIATVRIELLHTRPLIWRQVEVPTSITLEVLHDVVQIAMGWFDSHLWEFTIGKRRYGLSMDQDWGTEPRIEADKVRLRDVLKPTKTIIEYIYDFGDSWEHRLTVTDIRAGEPGISYPRYVAGKWSGPPEDCGGIPGFYQMLDVIADPGHPDHAEIKEWSDDFDPKVVDEASIKSALAHIADRRNTGGNRSKTKSAGPAS
ncbi:MAG: plasmid pRiA4b ORF-3 family protein [Proteobacteria bacterium]|nr:plasmid pRiA4b ORF-3 family protein [Pseudomonadota bacterium]